MSDLEAKVRLLVKDLEDLGTADRVKAILGFVRNELGLRESEHFLGVYDLSLIRSRAIALVTDMPTKRTIEGELVYNDPENFRAMCYAEAVFEFLRGKGFLSHRIAFREKKAEKRFCDHRRAELDPNSLIVSYVCQDCKAQVLPTMWKELKR